MPLTLATDPVPLTTDVDGVVRVGATRVTLDTVVAAFRNGASAEAIAEQYPSLPLAEVYAVVGYFLSHEKEVDAYLEARHQQAAEVRCENEQRTSPANLRERLLARRTDRS